MWDGYKTQRWVRLREKILRRDGYCSREAARYGNFRTPANVVHHCWPAEDFPEFAWAAWNLISVTEEEHRSFHNADGSLTAAGAAWKARTRPPPAADLSTGLEA